MINIPEESIGFATDHVRKEFMPGGGLPGILEELNKYLKEREPWTKNTLSLWMRERLQVEL